MTYQPATDTRPLQLKELSSEERDIIINVNDALRGIAGEAPWGTLAQEPWAKIDSEPTGRVLMINGGRGHGKTSLLLTLIDGWMRSLKRCDQNSPNPCQELDSQLGFRAIDGQSGEIAKVVRCLPILDFDPLPADMPIHAWLVHAWRGVATHYDKTRPGPEPSRTSQQKKSLVELWESAFRQAVLGWNHLPAGEHGSISQIIDRREQISDWQNLWRDWRAFIDEVVSRIYGSQNGPTDRGIVVVPIDDVDLQVSRIADLCHALRLFKHERVVYLLTADRQHMIEMLTHRFAGEQKRLAAAEHTEQIPRPWPGRIAHAAVEKLVPLKHVWTIEPVRLKTVLARIRTVAGELWKKQVSEDSTSKRSVGDWLTAWGQRHNIEITTYRRLQQVLDILLHPPMKTSEDVARDAHGGSVHQSTRASDEVGLHALAWLLANDDGRATYREGEGRVVYEGRGVVLASFQEDRFYSLEKQQQSVVMATQPRFYLKRELAWYEKEQRNERWTERTPTEDRSSNIAALVVGLARDSDHKIITAPALDFDIGPALMWTTWEGRPKGAIFLWPFAIFPTPLKLLEWANDWKGIAARMTPMKPADAVDFLAYHWITMQIREAGGALGDLWHASADETASKAEERPNDKDWLNLLQHVFPRESHCAKGMDEFLVLRWRQRELVLMAAPEFGLSRPRQQLIIESFVNSCAFLEMNIDAQSRAKKALYEYRREYMSDALWRYQDKYRPEEQTEPSTQDVERLIVFIEEHVRFKCHSDSYWSQHIDHGAVPQEEKPAALTTALPQPSASRDEK
ncbi:hypothetical protein WME91_45530 [Sorangium sp. So ce269]